LRLDLDAPAMTEPMQPLRERYANLMGQVQLRWNSVLSPVVFIIHHRNELLPVFRYQKISVLDRLMEIPQFSKALGSTMSPEKFTEFMKEHVEATAINGLQQLETSIFDSAIVFGHAILDDVLMQCLRLGYELKPGFFTEKVAQKRVTVQDVMQNGARAALNDAIEKWLGEQNRNSVLQKFDLLLALTAPKEPNKVIEGFAYSRTKIEELDDLRHSLAHSTKLRTVIYDDLNYLKVATNFALGLLTEIGADISLQHLMNGFGFDLQLPEGA
jgi:hypothetical protein